MGVKKTLELSKDYKRHEKMGAKKLKKQEERNKAAENMVTKDRLRCENIGSVFYSSNKP